MRNKENLRLILIVILIIFSSCKKQNEPTNDNKFQKENTNYLKQVNNNCISYLTELIIKSTIETPFINSLSLSIDKIENNQLTLKLFDKSDSQENAVGWVIFDAENKKLFDITNDILNPIELKYDSVIWNKIIDCQFNSKVSYKVNNSISECTENTSDYESEEICFFRNSIIKDVYENAIKNKELTNSENLLPKLPKKDTILDINENGLISISYTLINSKKIDIEFLFEGGVNTLALEQINNDVKRIIITSAD